MADSPTQKHEIFVYTDETGTEQWLAIGPLRQWAERNCQIVRTPIDLQKVEDIFKNKKIDEDWMQTHTFKTAPKPIIVCADFRGLASEIVDGNHTYVAFAAAYMHEINRGIKLPEPEIAAYVVTRAQMERFLVPVEARANSAKQQS